MTIKQIKTVCAGLVKLIRVAQVQGEDPIMLYEQFVYELVIRAYEESAKIADTTSSKVAARKIRALKNPLMAQYIKLTTFPPSKLP